MIIIGLAGSAAPAGAEPLAREPTSTVASGYGGVVAFSKYSAASRRYRLVARIGARVRVLRVRSRSAALAEAALVPSADQLNLLRLRRLPEADRHHAQRVDRPAGPVLEGDVAVGVGRVEVLVGVPVDPCVDVVLPGGDRCQLARLV